jgi:hydroxypyruvate reductase
MGAPSWNGLRADLAALHGAALAAADPASAVRRALRVEAAAIAVGDERIPLADGAEVRLVAAGKAALGMAGAAVALLGERLRGGVVAHPRGAPAAPAARFDWPAAIRRFPAGHPLPDEASLAAGRAARELLASPGEHDVVLVLLSGGASALLESPLPGVSLDEVRNVTRAVQRAGADVAALNAVRGGLSTLKHGGLARLAAPARVVTVAISDVLGDRPEDIGSGPTVPSPRSAGRAREVLERAGLAAEFPHLLERLAAAEIERRPVAPGTFRIVLSNRDAADAVLGAAVERGFRALLVSTLLQGEASEVGRMIGGCIASASADGVPLAPPACLVFGGETTVTVRGAGRGGRNQEVALGAALAIDGRPNVAVFSFATDGVDGSGSAAGAVATGDSVARATALGLSAHRALAENDSESFFRALGDAWDGGPSGTNVNDLVVALAYP